MPARSRADESCPNQVEPARAPRRPRDLDWGSFHPTPARDLDWGSNHPTAGPAGRELDSGSNHPTAGPAARELDWGSDHPTAGPAARELDWGGNHLTAGPPGRDLDWGTFHLTACLALLLAGAACDDEASGGGSPTGGGGTAASSGTSSSAGGSAGSQGGGFETAGSGGALAGAAVRVLSASGDETSSVGACVVLEDDALCCFGSFGSDAGASGMVPYDLGDSGALTVAAAGCVCAIDLAGATHCWGDNSYGCVDPSGATPVIDPTIVAGLPPMQSLTTAAYGGCGVSMDERVVCWGYVTEVFDAPTDLGLEGATEVSCFGGNCCALAGASAACWGSNTNGQLGVPASPGSTTPSVVQGLPPVVSVSAGGPTVCALTADSDLYCWGQGFGHVPVRIESLVGSVTSVAVLWSGICVSTTSGEVRCWGQNEDGILGNGTSGGVATEPTIVPGLAGVTEVSGSGYTVCSRAPDALHCWGVNPAGGSPLLSPKAVPSSISCEAGAPVPF